jgi:ADP-heptose:LPS heptosyltransferase
MAENLHKILVIQTASIGDVILATVVAEELHRLYPLAVIDFLLKSGIESLFDSHPFIRNVLVWDKKTTKYKHLFTIIQQIRAEKYDLVVNCQRFASSGIVTALSGASITSGFSKNPFSVFFTHRYKHTIKSGGLHETDRNLRLISFLGHKPEAGIKIYPQPFHFARMSQHKTHAYICIAPASLWFTKQYPENKWIEFTRALPEALYVFFLGSSSDIELCNRIIHKSGKLNCMNFSGKLSFLDSAALMRDAKMNFVNDSAPMHIASAMNAPVCAIFCSTVTDFGFGPLSTVSHVVETNERLNCRPCGLHGFNACPEKHFRCASSIRNDQLIHCL